MRGYQRLRVLHARLRDAPRRKRRMNNTGAGPDFHVFAAGLLLAEEAGARVTDGRGTPWDLHSTVYVVAASHALHEELLGLVQGTRITSAQITWT